MDRWVDDIANELGPSEISSLGLDFQVLIHSGGILIASTVCTVLIYAWMFTVLGDNRMCKRFIGKRQARWLEDKTTCLRWNAKYAIYPTPPGIPPVRHRCRQPFFFLASEA